MPPNNQASELLQVMSEHLMVGLTEVEDEAILIRPPPDEDIVEVGPFMRTSFKLGPL